MVFSSSSGDASTKFVLSLLLWPGIEDETAADMASFVSRCL